MDSSSARSPRPFRRGSADAARSSSRAARPPASPPQVSGNDSRLLGAGDIRARELDAVGEAVPVFEVDERQPQQAKAVPPDDARGILPGPAVRRARLELSIFTGPSSTTTINTICDGSAIDANRFSTSTRSKRCVAFSRDGDERRGCRA